MSAPHLCGTVVFRCLTFVVLRYVGATAVELEKVDAPVSERLCVSLHVTLAAREAGARVRTDVLVEAQLQAALVHLKRMATACVHCGLMNCREVTVGIMANFQRRLYYSNMLPQGPVMVEDTVNQLSTLLNINSNVMIRLLLLDHGLVACGLRVGWSSLANGRADSTSRR